MFNQSLTNLQFPDREEFLVELGAKMAAASELAQIEDIERLWFELQREIYESGKVVSFPAMVTQANGEQSEQTVVRVGLFNVVSDNGYLRVTEDGSLAELGRQPEGRLLSTTSALMNATS